MKETTTSEDADQQASRFWHLGADDQRTLYISVIGGLAANVGLIFVLALGLLEAHLIDRYRHTLLTLVLPQVAVTVVFYLGGSISDRRMSRRIYQQLSEEAATILKLAQEAGDDASIAQEAAELIARVAAKRGRPIYGRIVLGVGALLGAVVILGLMGFAAGIK